MKLKFKSQVRWHQNSFSVYLNTIMYNKVKRSSYDERKEGSREEENNRRKTIATDGGWSLGFHCEDDWYYNRQNHHQIFWIIIKCDWCFNWSFQALNIEMNTNTHKNRMNEYVYPFHCPIYYLFHQFVLWYVSCVRLFSVT